MRGGVLVLGVQRFGDRSVGNRGCSADYRAQTSPTRPPSSPRTLPPAPGSALSNRDARYAASTTASGHHTPSGSTSLQHRPLPLAKAKTERDRGRRDAEAGRPVTRCGERTFMSAASASGGAEHSVGNLGHMILPARARRSRSSLASEACATPSTHSPHTK
eukprot:2175678-Rhodomonas_salina.1